MSKSVFLAVKLKTVHRYDKQNYREDMQDFIWACTSHWLEDKYAWINMHESIWKYRLIICVYRLHNKVNEWKKIDEDI